MTTEISVPTLKNSENYELWKQETLAWAVITDLDKEKQAIAVALNLPDGKNIKENVFCELKLEDLNSENGMTKLFDFLDKYLCDDEFMNGFNKFEDFENFERHYGQNIREYVSNFELKVSKLEKLNMKLPSEILALKLLRKANLTKQERMIVLTRVNFADKENMYNEIKNSLIKFLGQLSEGKVGEGLSVRLEPGWKRSTSSRNLKCNLQLGSKGVMKKKLNALGSNGQILLCNSCGSYRHLVAECPDSWENMVKGKASEVNVELRDQRDKQKQKGKEKRSGEESQIGDKWEGEEMALSVMKEEIRKIKAEITEIKAVIDKELNGQKEEFTCGENILNKQVGAEITQLKEEIKKLKAAIKGVKGVKDKELKRQKGMSINDKTYFKHEKEQQKDMQRLIQRKMKFENEMSVSKEEMVKSVKLQAEVHRKDGHYGRTEDQSLKKLGSNRNSMGTRIDQRQDRKKETKMETIQLKVNENNGTKQRLLEKAKRVKQKLQRTSGGDKTLRWMCEKQMTQKLNESINTDGTINIRQWFWWPVERQQFNDILLNDKAIQVFIVNWVSKLLRNGNVLTDLQNII